MLRTTIQQAIPIPSRDYCLFTGDTPLKGIKIGETMTDGSIEYEIISIPLFEQRGTVEFQEPTDFILRPGDYDPRELIGKTLYAV